MVCGEVLIMILNIDKGLNYQGKVSHLSIRVPLLTNGVAIAEVNLLSKPANNKWH